MRGRACARRGAIRLHRRHRVRRRGRRGELRGWQGSIRLDSVQGPLVARNPGWQAPASRFGKRIPLCERQGGRCARVAHRAHGALGAFLRRFRRYVGELHLRPIRGRLQRPESHGEGQWPQGSHAPQGRQGGDFAAARGGLREQGRFRPFGLHADLDPPLREPFGLRGNWRTALSSTFSPMPLATSATRRAFSGSTRYRPCTTTATPTKKSSKKRARRSSRSTKPKAAWKSRRTTT